ncbi:MAG TPA: ATP-binding protein [Mycobacteriales bacterium]|nr:ATP-binding protein [Mycobacteriales bacterium]
MAIVVRVGTESILNYKRLSYDVWYALAEFIDNSTQSFFNNRSALEDAFQREGRGLEVRVVYDRDTDVLRITDNAMGMSLGELDKALQIASPPDNTSGRSEFGMGLKTAACWLGDYWIVRTKKLGEENEYEVHFNVPDVAAGVTSLEPNPTPKAKDLHYTTVEIRQMHQKLAGRTIGKTKDFLRSIYRLDVREGLLDLRWDQEALVYDDSLDILRAADGREYRTPFDFMIGDKKVQGWIAVLNSGGRPKAGFAIVRRGRVVQGQPTAWRPHSIFGQEQGSNNLVNQRLVGEVHLDKFMISHTKDSILWQGDEEEQIEEKLKEVAAEYAYVADRARKGRSAGSGPTTVEVDTAIDELRHEMESDEFADLIEIGDVPPPELARAAIDPVVESTRGQRADLSITVGPTTVRVFLTKDTSPNDPYYASDYPEGSVIVIVNTRHPYWSQISGSEGVLNFLRHCVYDALAEWKCTRKIGELQPDTVKLLKDTYLRLPMVIG